jgi:hypothetical protein
MELFNIYVQVPSFSRNEALAEASWLNDDIHPRNWSSYEPE